MNKREFLKRAGVTFPAAILVSPAEAQGPAASTYGSNILNAASFGAIVANATFVQAQANANLATIQAAIDYAYKNNIYTIRLPQFGQPIWMPNTPLFLDVPANRTGGASAVLSGYTTGGALNFNFSLHLDGSASQLKWKNNYTGICLVVGPGQGMRVTNLSVVVNHIGLSCIAARPATSIGIGWTGGPGGGFRCLLRDVYVAGAHTLVKTGWNEDQLADRLRLDNCFLQNGYRGLHISQTQNFLVEVRNCDIDDCIESIYNPQQFAVNVQGGGYQPHAGGAAVFRISGTSALILVSGGYEFTTVVASPDAQISASGYNRFALKTAHFGVVPCTLVSYTRSTIRLRLRDSWLGHSSLPPADTDIQADIQAATQLFCVEMGTNFRGPVHASEFHAEAPLPYCMLDTASDNMNFPSWIKGVKYNGDPSAGDLASNYGAGNANEARYLVAQTHPHFSLGNQPTVIEDIAFGNTYQSNGIMVDMASGAFTSDHVFARLQQAQLNIRHPGSQLDDNENYGPNAWKGMGRFDRTPFLPRLNMEAINFLTRSDNAVPHRGYRPEPSATPILTPNQYSIVSGSLASVNLGTYPLIWGGRIYKVEKDGETVTARKFVCSAHVGYSYGQDLTTAKIRATSAWRFRGASNCVYMDDVSITYMFPGLVIILNFASGDHAMIVTGVFPMKPGTSPTSGYVTVAKVTIGTGNVHQAANDGVKTTDYTGSTIKQALYRWTTAALI